MDFSREKEIELQMKSKFPNCLEIGDRCKATIRHKTDGSKNLINVDVIVCENNKEASFITVQYKNKKYTVPYNELSVNLLKTTNIYLVEKVIDEDFTKSEFQGIFSTKEKAIAACRDENYFWVEAILDEEQPHETCQFKEGKFGYPKREC